MNLIIIRGYSGTGKTTSSIKLAKDNRFQLINYDTFFFGLNRHNNFIKSDFIICFQSVLNTLENCMRNKRTCVLEGALAPIHRLDVFNFDEITSLAKRYGYSINNFKLVAKKSTCSDRIKNRGTIVNNKTYDKLVKKIESIKIPDEIIIKTDNLSIDETASMIETYIRHHKDSSL